MDAVFPNRHLLWCQGGHACLGPLLLKARARAHHEAAPWSSACPPGFRRSPVVLDRGQGPAGPIPVCCWGQQKLLWVVQVPELPVAPTHRPNPQRSLSGSIWPASCARANAIPGPHPPSLQLPLSPVPSLPVGIFFFAGVRLGAGWAIGKFRSQTRLLREWKALCSRDCNAPRPLAPDPNCGSPHHGSLPLIGNKDMVALILAAHASIATT